MSNRKGQNVAEYSILIALVIAAAIAMQTYVKRGLQGRVADAVDHAPNISQGNLTLNFTTRQYEPYYLKSEAEVTTDRTAQERLAEGGQFNRTAINETTSRAGGAYERTGWEGGNVSYDANQTYR